MTDLIVELSKYLMTLLFAFYTYECFSSFRGKLTPEKRAKIFKRQMCLMYLIHLDAFLAIYAVTDDIRMILFYVVQAAFIAVTISSYRLVYGRASGLLINNMCMLLMIGFIMITRLSVFMKKFPHLRQILFFFVLAVLHFFFHLLPPHPAV